jgi:hypothetical protein
LVFHVEGETLISVVWGFLSGAISSLREDGMYSVSDECEVEVSELSTWRWRPLEEVKMLGLEMRMKGKVQCSEYLFIRSHSEMAAVIAGGRPSSTEA